MVDFINSLIGDLPEQYREKPKIEALFSVIGKQMNEINLFYDQLNTLRSVHTASGETLDKIGEILVIDRLQAQELMQLTETITEEQYRSMLAYKIMLNFGDGTFKSILSCIKILRNGMLGFRLREDIKYPATLLMETDDSPWTGYVQQMLKTPIPRAAGVGVKMTAKEEESDKIGAEIVGEEDIETQCNAEEADVYDEYVWYVDENEVTLCDEKIDVLLHSGRETGVVSRLLDEEETA